MGLIKTLSMKSPYGQLIRDGKKTIETRTWATAYRGPILFVCSQKPSAPESGMALCVADLIDIRPMSMDDQGAARCLFYPRAMAWILKNVRPVKPFPVRGQLGLFDVPDYLIQMENSKQLAPPRARE